MIEIFDVEFFLKVILPSVIFIIAIVNKKKIEAWLDSIGRGND